MLLSAPATTPDSDERIAVLGSIVLSIPQYRTQRVDAVAILCGMGERRAEHAATLLDYRHHDDHHPICLVALPRASERTAQLSWRETDRVVLAHGLLFSCRSRVVIESGAQENTRTNALWIAEEVVSRNIKSLALVTASYHMLRGVLSVIKALSDKSLYPLVLPAPMPLWNEPVPELTIREENVVRAREMFAREILKIREYQTLGHVATLDELETYLGRTIHAAWWGQPSESD